MKPCIWICTVLHSFARLSDPWHQRFPAWFDEGLASVLSHDDRLTTYADPRDADWIKQAQGFRQWGRLHRDHKWQDTYGVAYALVAEMREVLGQDGLRHFVDQAAQNGDFSMLYARKIQPDWG